MLPLQAGRRRLNAEMASERRFHFGFVVIAALSFTASAVLTIVWSGSMSAAEGMPMPGGWTMSMAWMRMPGQTWTAATASFIGMWITMMMAMMLPSVAPALWRYGQSIGTAHKTARGRLTTLVCLGYFFVWTMLGCAVFPLGVLAATIEMKQPALARAVPVTAAVVVVMAAFIQLTAWKTRTIDLCREVPARGNAPPAGARTAWRQGLRFGLHCCLSCANLMTVLLIVGVMDLRVTAVVTAVISAERLAPAGKRVAQVSGACVILAELLIFTQGPTYLG